MFNRSAVLIVVDVQNGFVREQSKHVIPIIVDLVNHWQTAGGDVVFTRYFNYPGSNFERLFKWSKLMESPDTDIIPELVPYVNKATAVVDKTVYSFFNEEGIALVRDHRWTDIYVCGVATESCVLKTAVDAFDHGDHLTPWLIEDASASHAGQIAHNAGILVTSRFIGPNQIIKSTDIPWEKLTATT